MSKINEVKAPIVTKILKLDEVISYSQFAVSGIDSSLNKLQHILDEYVYLKKQAQKQEKLLELYKEINNKRKELIQKSRHNTWSWKLDIEIKYIQDKIRELENNE